MGLKPFKLPKSTKLPPIGWDVDFVVTDCFFDRDNVKKHLDDGERKVLKRFGAYVRRVALNSMKHRKHIMLRSRKPRDYASKPGQPPYSHADPNAVDASGKRLFPQGGVKKGPFNIVYGYNPQRRSVIIGPRKFNDKNDYIPYHLEYGRQGGGFQINRRRKHYEAGKSAGPIRIQPAGTKMSGSQIRKIRSYDGKDYSVVFTKLRTQKQVNRSNRIAEKLWGPIMLRVGSLAPRPYMRPAFAKGTAKLPEFWKDAKKVYFTGG